MNAHLERITNSPRQSPDHYFTARLAYEIVADFRDTGLYTEAFLNDLERGLRRSSYVQRHGNHATSLVFR